MAQRKCFIVDMKNDSFFQEKTIDFEYFNGFSLVQKQKSIISLHKSILNIDKDFKVLEISTKSVNSIGKKLSAFNLRFYDESTNRNYAIENVFQSSKVFENGGPFVDLLTASPQKSKTDSRLNKSVTIVGLEPFCASICKV